MPADHPTSPLRDPDTPGSGQERDEDLYVARIYEAITWRNIQRFLPLEGSKVLNAGGGTGRISVQLARLGYQVTLTDVSRGMLQVAREKLKAKGLLDRALIQQLEIVDIDDLADDSFGLVIAQGDTLSYCQDPDRAVADLARVARSGGHVIVSANSRMTAAITAMATGFWKEAGRILISGDITWQSDDATSSFPVHTFNVGELRGLFEKHGLRVVRVLAKPAFFSRLSADAQVRILRDERSLGRLLDLEAQFGDDPAWAGSASYFEMTGKR